MPTPLDRISPDEDGNLTHLLSDAAMALQALVTPTPTPGTAAEQEASLQRVADLARGLSVADGIGLRLWKRAVDRSGRWEAVGTSVPDGALSFDLSPNARRCAVTWVSADNWDEVGRTWADGVELPSDVPGSDVPSAYGAVWLDDDRCYSALLLDTTYYRHGRDGPYGLLLWDARTRAGLRLLPPPDQHWRQARASVNAQGQWTLTNAPGADLAALTAFNAAHAQPLG